MFSTQDFENENSMPQDLLSTGGSDQPASVVTGDEIVRLLSPGNGLSLFKDVVTTKADTKGGADRVNKNTANTGAVAYKDDKGQTVLTNVAKDASGKEVPIGSITPSVSTQQGKAQATLSSMEAPLVLTSILDKLGKVQDASEARGIFASFQEAAAREQVNIETQALQMAQAKLGISALEQTVMKSEATDKVSIGYYPGIGDSPITQKARAELMAARGFADKEQQRILSGNLHYKILGNQLKQAEAEMTRVQKVAESKARIQEQREMLGVNRTLANEEWDRRNTANEKDKEEQEKRKQLAEAEGYTDVQRRRIQALNMGELGGLDLSLESTKIKLAQVSKRNSADKNFKAAILAEGADLPALALKGNAFAKTLTIAEESKNTGLSTDQVEQALIDMQKLMSSKNFLEDAIKNLGTDQSPDARKQAIAEVQGLKAASTVDPSKAAALNDVKIRFAMQQVQANKTARFLEDVSSWQSTDPRMQIAVKKASIVSNTKDIESVLAAYLTDTNWVPLTGKEYLTAMSQFRKNMHDAAQKHKGSMFGMPDYRSAEVLIAKKSVESGVFRKMLGLSEKARPVIDAMGRAASGDMQTIGSAIHDSAAGRAVRSFILGEGWDKAPIDEATGKPFGE